MRRSHRLLCLALALLLSLTMLPNRSAADYTYTVRLYAGNCGTVGGQQIVTIDGLRYGDRVTFRVEDVEVTAGEKYYVRGFRESGRDNDTVDSPSFTVTGDRDYVVAYGVRGNLVAYTVRYQDADGGTLLPDATFYGNIGDKPVVAFRYIDGYQPRYYNITKTLSENAAENVFTFSYDKLPASQRSAAVRESLGVSVEAATYDAVPHETSIVPQEPASVAAETVPVETASEIPAAAATEAITPDTAATETAETPAPVETAETPAPVETSATAATETAEIVAPEESETVEETALASLPAPQELLDLDTPDGRPVEAPTAQKQSGVPLWVWILLGVCVCSLLGLALALLLGTRRKRR